MSKRLSISKCQINYWLCSQSLLGWVIELKLLTAGPLHAPGMRLDYIAWLECDQGLSSLPLHWRIEYG